MGFRTVALIVCIIWALGIALVDLLTYRIPNLSLALGIVLVWPSLYLTGQNFSFTFAVLAFTLLAIIFGLSSLVGMGDVKLLLFLAPWLHYDAMQNPLLLLIALSWIQLTVGVVFKRGLPQRIAFAPAILAAAALNMAT